MDLQLLSCFGLYYSLRSSFVGPNYTFAPMDITKLLRKVSSPTKFGDELKIENCEDQLVNSPRGTALVWLILNCMPNIFSKPFLEDDFSFSCKRTWV